jgi:hypothetical protein
MMNIREYFNNLYNNATTEVEFERVSDYEYSVYEMGDGFEKWAKANNVDLTAMGPHGITVLQYWAWDFED